MKIIIIKIKLINKRFFKEPYRNFAAKILACILKGNDWLSSLKKKKSKIKN